MDSSTSVREELARRSEEWNVDNDSVFNALWPDYKDSVQRRRREEKEQKAERKANGEDEAGEQPKASNGTPKAEEGKKETKQERRNEGGGGGGGGNNNRGGARLPLGMDKLMGAIALFSVAFGVVILYTYH